MNEPEQQACLGLSRRQLGVLAGVLGMIFLWTLAPLQGYDFWWNLAVGRDIVEGKGIPWEQSYLGTTSVYGFDAYANLAWLGSLLFFIWFKFGGILGLVFLRSFLLAGLGGLTYLNCRLAGLAHFSACIWMSFGVWAIRSRFLLRTYLLTDVCLALLVSLLLLRWRKRIEGKRLALGLSLLFCIWSNSHPGYIAGFILLGIWLITLSVPAKEGMLCCLVAFLATLVRPHGLSYLQFFYDHFANPTSVTGVLEWSPLDWRAALANHGVFVFIGISMALFGLSRSIRTKQAHPPWSFLLICLAFTMVSFRSQRSVAEILPIVTPLCASYFPKFKWSKLTKIWAGVFIISLFGWVFHWFPHSELVKTTARYPVALSELVKKEGGQVFNSYEFGNYLSFAEVPPFVHGLTGLYEEDLLRDFLTVLNRKQERDPILDRFKVRHLLLHYPTEVDAHQGFVRDLFDSPDWRLVAWDDAAILFSRAEGLTGLRSVRPWDNPSWTNPQEAKQELLSLVETHPSARAYVYLSELAIAEQSWVRAQTFGQKALQISPNDPRAWTSLVRTSAILGDLQTTLKGTEILVNLTPMVAPVHFNRALALLARSGTENGMRARWSRWLAKCALKNCLEIDPEFRPALTKLAELD